MIKLNLGLVYDLSVKQKNQIVKNFGKKKKKYIYIYIYKLIKMILKHSKIEPRTNSSNLMLEILDLSCSTWLS